jgi:heme iron utilization protein
MTVSGGTAPRDHGEPGDAPSVPPTLTRIANPARPSAAEESRTVVASTNAGTLASLTMDGDPWASHVTYGLLEGAPVLCVGPASDPDPLAGGRVTLAGVVERPAGDERGAARDAHLAGVPAAKYYIDYSDFSLWILRVQRVRWVGGYGRMESASGEAYLAAQPDPVKPHAHGAIAHPNADHSESLRLMAQSLGGYPDTTAATCTGVDRYGLDLRVSTRRGVAYTRIGYHAAINLVDELRPATVELVRQATAVTKERGPKGGGP